MVIRLIHSGFRGVSWIIEPVLHDIFFVQSYRRGTYGHFWSLAVEEHFYIILPLMLYFHPSEGARRRDRSVSRLASHLSIGCDLQRRRTIVSDCSCPAVQLYR